MIKFSYLISSYDSGHFLDRRLHNLLVEQTDKDLEAIVVNPNSPGTDGAIAEKWASQDKRVNYLYWPQREPYGASWLRAWRNAKGEFVCNANADDFCHPKFNEIVYPYIKRDISYLDGPKIGFGYTGIQVNDEFGRLLGGGLKPKFDFEEYSHTCYGGPQLIWRNDEEFKLSLDWKLMDLRASQYKSAFDYWLILYFMSLGYHGSVVPHILTIYTQRPTSIENSNKWLNNWETYSSISEFFPHNFDTKLKHAREFKDFKNLPPKEEWVDIMKAGKKWKS